MTQISVQADQMGVVLGSTERSVRSATDALGGFSSTADGGVASDKLTFVVRVALEAAQLAADASSGVCAVARAALDGQLADEAEITDALDNFHGKSFD